MDVLLPNGSNQKTAKNGSIGKHSSVQVLNHFMLIVVDIADYHPVVTLSRHGGQ